MWVSGVQDTGAGPGPGPGLGPGVEPDSFVLQTSVSNLERGCKYRKFILEYTQTLHWT